MNIPIDNLYYLLVYAWDVLDEAALINTSAEPTTHLSSLYARVLIGGLQNLLRRGMDRGYAPRREALTGPRGKFDLSATIKANAQLQGQIVCEFDELTYDVLHNRILKSTLGFLLRVNDLDREMHKRVKAIYRSLREISDVPITARDFRKIQLHRHIGIYRYLLAVCRLIHDTLLVNQEDGSVSFRDFTRDRRLMAHVFQKFIENFYRHEQQGYKVHPESFPWQMTAGAIKALRRLPRMQTDVGLQRIGERVVVEAKFYRNCFQKHHGKRTLRSGHLYQLFAYLQNLARRYPADRIDGLLLYPTVSRTVRLDYQIHGHHVRVRTIDLSKKWLEIRASLIEMIDFSV